MCLTTSTRRKFLQLIAALPAIALTIPAVAKLKEDTHGRGSDLWNTGDPDYARMIDPPIYVDEDGNYMGDVI